MISEKEEFGILAYLLEIGKIVSEPAYIASNPFAIRYLRIDGLARFFTAQFNVTNLPEPLRHKIGVHFESNYGALISNSAMFTYKRGHFICGTEIEKWWGMIGSRLFNRVNAHPGEPREFVDLTKYDKVQDAVDKYVNELIHSVKTIKVAVTPCPVVIELPAFEQTYTHLISKTLVSDLQAGIRKYLQQACISFQKEFSKKFIENLTTEICGVPILAEEMDQLFDVSDTELGRSNFSIKVILLCTILTQSRKKAEAEVNLLLTCDNLDKQQVGRIIFRLLNALPDNAKKFPTT